MSNDGYTPVIMGNTSLMLPTLSKYEYEKDKTTPRLARKSIQDKIDNMRNTLRMVHGLDFNTLCVKMEAVPYYGKQARPRNMAHIAMGPNGQLQTYVQEMHVAVIIGPVERPLLVYNLDDGTVYTQRNKFKAKKFNEATIANQKEMLAGVLKENKMEYDSSNYTKAQLDAIVNAFADLCNGLEPHHYGDETGEYSKEAEDNYRLAKDAIYPGSVRFPK